MATEGEGGEQNVTGTERIRWRADCVGLNTEDTARTFTLYSK